VDLQPPERVARVFLSDGSTVATGHGAARRPARQTLEEVVGKTPAFRGGCPGVPELVRSDARDTRLVATPRQDRVYGSDVDPTGRAGAADEQGVGVGVALLSDPYVPT